MLLNKGSILKQLISVVPWDIWSLLFLGLWLLLFILYTIH
ncbi:hypothetical protein HMPREF1982_04677 [Clostridiales bacterium oral taxon 876 str. F0540]|nr:hypothetical protein HMPREF1982_04677 [Clostridiales bacterium oral taxon 876 str. F0540]